MTQLTVIELARDALTVSLLVAGPFLGFSMLIGVLVAIFQAVTSIQELTLTFVPKTLGVALAAVLFGPWVLDTLTVYTATLLASLPQFAR